MEDESGIKFNGNYISNLRYADDAALVSESRKKFQKMLDKLNFSCSYIKTNLKPLDLWDEPVAVAELLQQWTDAMAAAGGGLGTPV